MERRSGEGAQDWKGPQQHRGNSARQRLQVTVDDRERGSGTITSLRRIEGLQMKIQRLSLGDYLWNGELLFERKTVVDLIRSIKDGRLLRQACQLAANRHRPVLILEGTGSVSTGMKRRAIQGALIAITVRLGIPLLRSTDPDETVRLMLYSVRQSKYTRARTSPRLRGTKKPTRKRSVQLDILQGIPGVGPGRAEQLIQTFGSIRGVANATSAQLQDISGIGRATAETIRWAVK